VKQLENLVSIKEVSKATGIAVGTLYHWVSEGKIPVVRLSKRCIRFRLADLALWVDAHSTAPEPNSFDSFNSFS
jgi:excisionase family DNA binding protein